MGIFLKKTLAEIAVEAEKVADTMAGLARVSNSGSSIDLKFHRFSADNGVCFVKMDKYKELDHIEELTIQYISCNETQASLKELGEEIANEYLGRHNDDVASSSVPKITIANV